MSEQQQPEQPSEVKLDGQYVLTGQQLHGIVQVLMENIPLKYAYVVDTVKQIISHSTELISEGGDKTDGKEKSS
jgi:hypothetical protein